MLLDVVYYDLMLAPLLLAYYIDQFRLPAGSSTYRPVQTMQYMQSVQPKGKLTVDAESTTAAVPPGSQRVEMLRLRLTAECGGDVTINTIAVQRRGLGLSADVVSVYAMHRGVRISSASGTPSRDGTVSLNTRGFTISTCDTEDVTILADFSPDAAVSGQHRFELKAIDAGTSTVRIDQRDGDFTRTLRTTGPRVGQVSVDYLKLTSTAHYGARQLLLRFTLAADGVDDQVIHAITFTNRGSASDADLRNLSIDYRSRAVSDIAAQLSAHRVRLVFNPPYVLEKNQTLKFGLRGDIVASRSRTIQFVIEEPGDIESTVRRGR